jgi:cation:H+ antiporter
MLFLYILLIIILCLVLIKGANITTKALIFIANYFKLPKFTIAFLLAGAATSLPEMIIGISSGLHHSSNLTLGNILGANIVNITLVLGLIIILAKGLKSDQKIVETNTFLTIILTILPLILLLDGVLSRIEGLILIFLFIFYVFMMLRKKEKFEEMDEAVEKKNLAKNILWFIAGIIILILSAEAIVKISSIITVKLNIQLMVIGSLILALGTTLPELAFNTQAIKLGNKEMILGNILGSLAFNSIFILGLTSIISPIIIENQKTFLIGACFLVISLFIYMLFSRTNKKITSKEGVILIFIYLLFFCSQILIK